MLIQPGDLRIIKIDEPEPDPQGVAVSGGARFARAKAKSNLQEVIGQLSPEEHIHVISKGGWSMHNVLEHVLKQTGPADVWITSWTITENPMRLILDLIKSGQIRKFRALFNERVEAMNPIAHQVARFNMDVRLTKIHAKCIVVINDQWGIAVSGSANFTKNPRIEKYVISTHRAVAEAERSWIDDEMNGAQPFRADE